MRAQIEDIDKKIQERLFNYSAIPPEMVWKRIESDLQAKKSRSLVPYLLKISAVLLLSAGIIAIVWKQTHPDVENVVVAEQKLNAQTNNILIQKQVTKPIPNLISQNNSAIRIKDNTNQILSVSAKKVFKNTPNSSEKSVLLITDSSVNVKELAVASSIKIENETETTLSLFKSTDTVSVQTNEAPRLVTSTPIPEYKPVFEVLPTEVDQQNARRWAISGLAGPQYAYRDINSPAGVSDKFNSNETPIVAFAGGINVEMEAYGRFSIKSGISYSKIGSEKSSISLETIDKVNTGWESADVDVSPQKVISSTGSITYDDPKYDALLNFQSGIQTSNVPGRAELTSGDLNTEELYEYIEIPFAVSYRIIDRKLDVNISGGLIGNILVNQEFNVSNDQGFYLEGTTDVNSFNYSGSLSIGFEYPIFGEVRFNCEPIFKYFLTPINPSYSVEVHPYTFGIMTGLTYTF